jgi:hypothetical protein
MAVHLEDGGRGTCEAWLKEQFDDVDRLAAPANG